MVGGVYEVYFVVGGDFVEFELCGVLFFGEVLLFVVVVVYWVFGGEICCGGF